MSAQSWTFDILVPCGTDGQPLEPATGNARVHHMNRSKIHFAIRSDTAILARSERNRLKAPAADGLRIVESTVWRGKGRQFLDPDNCTAWLKPFLDGLADSDWIQGDRRTQIDLRMPKQERGDPARITFTITELVMGKS